MQYRKGAGGQDWSALGFGCMRFSRSGAGIDQDEAEREILRAVELGVNYFDTAYIYPGSEECLGRILEKNALRERVMIATKLPQYLISSTAAIEKYFREQLRRLRTDWIDQYLMHMLTDVDAWNKLCALGIREWIDEKKKAGAIRQIGFSFHGNTEMFLRILESYDWDFCQIQYNYMDEVSQAGRAGLQAAAARGIPVVIMEPLRGGKLVSLLPERARARIREEGGGRSAAELAFRWLWDQAEVTTVLSGMNSLEMLEENCRIASEALPGCMSGQERQLVENLKKDINEKLRVGCTGCGYCMPCPQGVDIPGAFRCYNLTATESKTAGLREYFQTVALRREPPFPSQCVACGKCQRHCPQHLPIIEELKKADRAIRPWYMRPAIGIARKWMFRKKKEAQSRKSGKEYGKQMKDQAYRHGGFTLPGEAGYEKLTLEMAEKWGADVIRDSDGTKLSPEITEAGYRIYSTICIIREHNEFAAKHPDAQQQTFLSSDPVMAEGEVTVIRPLEGFFEEQFQLNDSPEAMAWWEVWDRTKGERVPRENWSFAEGQVTVRNCRKYHRYTVSFLCWRIWEEINMYNHTTNHWTTEHLRQLDPRHPEAWSYLQQWLRNWCENNPQTNVIRLTSLFYNFVWIFGSDLRRRTRFTDWASYDFTVSPAALEAFRAEYGYALTAEDFIRGGKLQATHRPPTPAKRDYMDMIQRFVAEKARTLVEIIHSYGKEAYVFYDDSWVGMEPYGKYFRSIGFDGLIKCVFSGFECRLCAGAEVPVHELRFHPYLFPVGLGGLPTFMEGGHPERDAAAYWMHVRRALARQCVDRIGLGGYLHLTIGQEKFNDAIEEMGIEFRHLKELHAQGAPAELPVTVAVLHCWGSLRSWTLSGHFHETDGNILIHLNEALSGLPVKVKFISFEDVRGGALKDADVLINAGREGDAWSGGDAWKDPEIVEEITRFVYEGGALIGAGEPSAAEGMDTRLALAHLLGVDLDRGDYACHFPWSFEEVKEAPFRVDREAVGVTAGIRLTDPETRVLMSRDGIPALTVRECGKGRAVYLGGFTYSPGAARMLLEMLLYLTGADGSAAGHTSHPLTECAWFPASRTLVVMNQGEEPAETEVSCPGGTLKVRLEAEQTLFCRMDG